MEKQGDKLLQDLKDKAQQRDRIRKLAWILTRPIYEADLICCWMDYFNKREADKLFDEYEITAEAK